MTFFLPLIAGTVSFVAAMPLGPVNLEVIRRSLERPARAAVIFAAGAACADGLWPLVTYFGLTPFMEIRWVSAVFWGLASMVLVFLGLSFIRDVRDSFSTPLVAPKIKKERFSFFTGFFLVSTNPTNLATWVTVIGTLHQIGLLPPPTWGSGFVLWIAVASGTLGYFCLLIYLVKRNHHFFIVPIRLKRIKILFGCLILGIAAYFAFNLIHTIWMK